MATLPRTSKLSNASPIHPPSVVASSLFDNPVPVPARPHSEFDSGINTSAAWTEHRQLHTGTGSLSDDEPDTDDEQQHGRPARALYVFEGKTEFRELSVDAGDEIEVLKEELADGWSLVKSADGEMGLLPRSYYTVCFAYLRAYTFSSLFDVVHLRFHCCSGACEHPTTWARCLNEHHNSGDPNRSTDDRRMAERVS